MSSEVARMVGVKLPIRSVPLQACVSEPLKAFLDPIVVSGSLHIYVSQSARGELVMGGATDPYPLYSTRSTLDFTEGLMANMLELFPFLENAKVLRQWAGIADMTPDFSPVMGTERIGFWRRVHRQLRQAEARRVATIHEGNHAMGA